MIFFYFFYALLDELECSEYVIFKVGTVVRMFRDPPTLLGHCPKFDRIYFFDGFPKLFNRTKFQKAASHLDVLPLVKS